MAHFIQANTNGRLHDAAEPSISPLNRGFLYGDAVYEVWRTYHDVLFAFDEHWRRLGRSARALHMKVDLTPERLIDEIRRTVSAYRAQTGDAGDVYVRLQITRGAGAIGLDLSLASEPEWVIYAQRLKPSSAKPGRDGFHLHIARDLFRNPPGALNPAWKTGNYLNNALCLHEARAVGADEVLILNQHGEVTEAAVSNVFFVEDNHLVTPPLAAGILEGITRGLIVDEIAVRAGLKVCEQVVRPEDFRRFSECFLSSSTRDIEPVARIDEKEFAIGSDTATARLKVAFSEYAATYAAVHPELRV